MKHRVVFGDTLTPPNMAEGSEDAQYRLYAVIVHMGTSAAHGAPSAKTEATYQINPRIICVKITSTCLVHSFRLVVACRIAWNSG